MPPRPTATATIGTGARRAAAAGDHVVDLVIEMSTLEGRFADQAHVTDTARRSLAACMPGRAGEIRAISTSRKGKGGSVSTVVVAVEASAVCGDRPTRGAVELLRAVLLGEGYRVLVRERRACDRPACSTEAVIGWDQQADIPSGWFATSICGRHAYRRCTRCLSVYVLSSTNAAGQAPAVHCEVCGLVLVEWGSSKIWSAELIARGAPPG